jgi:hypothetical protein
MPLPFVCSAHANEGAFLLMAESFPVGIFSSHPSANLYVVLLQGASSSAAASGPSSLEQPLLADRGAHAWARLRLADPVEAGRDLGSHFTK